MPIKAEPRRNGEEKTNTEARSIEQARIAAKRLPCSNGPRCSVTWRLGPPGRSRLVTAPPSHEACYTALLRFILILGHIVCRSRGAAAQGDYRRKKNVSVSVASLSLGPLADRRRRSAVRPVNINLLAHRHPETLQANDRGQMGWSASCRRCSLPAGDRISAEAVAGGPCW